MGGLLERDDELSALARHASAAAGGAARVVIVQGPAGIGKTTLLDRAAGVAAGGGLEVLRAVGGELERDDPFGIVRQLFVAPLATADEEGRAQLLAGEAAWAARALDLGPARGSGDVAAALHGLYWLTVGLAARRPLALLVDDAHWADDQSARFLELLARRGAGVPLLLVVASRPAEPGAPAALRAVEAAPEAQVVRLSALSESAAQAVVRDAVPEADAAFCRACHEATGGNPFLLAEVARAARTGGTTDAAGLDALRPEGILRAVLRRLATAPPAAAALADAAAILGVEGELRHGAALAGLSLEEAETAAGTLAALGILDDAAGPLRFVHPVVRTAIYDARPAAERSSAHRRHARRLLDEGAEPERVALHLLASAPAEQPWVVQTLRHAARRARGRGAPEAAVRYLRRALAEPPHADRADVLRELAASERRLSDPAALDHLAEAIAASDDPDAQRADRRRLAFWRYGNARGLDEAVGLLDAVADETGGRAALDDRANALAIAIWAGTDDLARRTAELEAVADPPDLVRAALAYRAVTLGVPPDGHLVELERVTRRLTPAANAVQPPMWSEIACCCAFVGAYEALDAMVGAALEAARAAGSIYHMVTPLTWAAVGALRRGRLAAAEQLATQALEAVQHGLMSAYLHPASYVLVEVALERGDVAGSRAHVDAAGMETDTTAMLSRAWTLPAPARVAVAEGRLEHGLALLRESGAQLARHEVRNPAVAWWRSTMAVALAGAGRGQEAIALADEEVALARTAGAPRSLGVALRAAGVARGGADAIDLLREAETVLLTTDAPLELARVRADLGGALRRLRHRRDAREPLRLALDGAIRTGATVLAQQARDELAATGARLRTGALSGLEAVTPSERRVAELAAQGLTNRRIAETLFVSPKTVEAHLGRVYRKLDVSSREELALALAPDGG